MRAYISSKDNINALDLLREVKETLNNLPFEIEEYSKKIFASKEIRQFIIEANQKLLSQGLRPDLTPIDKIPVDNQKSKFYERYTIYKRTEEDLQTQFVDLYRTGFFYESLQVKAGSQELLEFSTDPKSVKLEEVWGNILGISSEDLLELIYIIRPKIITFVKEKLKRS